MSSGELEGLASAVLCDKLDSTRLTWREIKDGWGSCTNFFLSFGLKPYNFEDHNESLSISRSFKEGGNDNDVKSEKSAAGKL